jgi:NAD(P)-dependent dehydrogenase (short-subunit alcohol dehydrogenase family)
MEDIADKVAFIPGGANGVGLAMARSFSAGGTKVAISDVEQAALDRVKDEFAGSGADVILLKLDVTDRDAMEQSALQTEAAFGKVQLVCDIAGVAVTGRFHKMDYKDCDWILAIAAAETSESKVNGGACPFRPSVRRDRSAMNTSYRQMGFVKKCLPSNPLRMNPLVRQSMT